MNIYIEQGDLLESNRTVICHQVNCQGVMNAGLAKSMRLKYPIVFSEYLKVVYSSHKEDLLGRFLPVQVNDTKYVGNLFGQLYYGRDKNITYTNYSALKSSVYELHEFMKNNNIQEVAFPYLMGCKLGNGNWEIVYQIIIEEFLGSNINIYFYQM